MSKVIRKKQFTKSVWQLHRDARPADEAPHTLDNLDNHVPTILHIDPYLPTNNTVPTIEMSDWYQNATMHQGGNDSVPMSGSTLVHIHVWGHHRATKCSVHHSDLVEREVQVPICALTKLSPLQSCARPFLRKFQHFPSQRSRCVPTGNKRCGSRTATGQPSSKHETAALRGFRTLFASPITM